MLWIGVGAGHPHLFQLYKRVQEAALQSGIEPELRPWHPHITLARCRDVQEGAFHKFLKSNTVFNAGMFRVEDLLYTDSGEPNKGFLSVRPF